LNLPQSTAGVVVTDISSDSPAQDALQANDVIEEINRQPVRSAQEYEELISKLGEHDAVLLLISRDGGSIYLTLQQ
jgi:serine protease Do